MLLALKEDVGFDVVVIGCCCDGVWLVRSGELEHEEDELLEDDGDVGDRLEDLKLLCRLSREYRSRLFRCPTSDDGDV